MGYVIHGLNESCLNEIMIFMKFFIIFFLIEYYEFLVDSLQEYDCIVPEIFFNYSKLFTTYFIRFLFEHA